MTLRVDLVGEVVGEEVISKAKSRSFAEKEFFAMLTNFEVPEALDDLGPQWVLPLEIGDGPARRSIRIELQPFLTASAYRLSHERPISVRPWSLDEEPCGLLFFFRDKFFLAERAIATLAEREEAVLRIKKAVYDSESELTALRSYVANVEAAVAYERSGYRREPIPDDVKLLVWSRDRGSCTRCDVRDKLHFDHIIPVAKGGGNDANNIQLLCQTCNLRKSDRIAFS